MKSFNPDSMLISEVDFDGKTDYQLFYPDKTTRIKGNFNCNELNSTFTFYYKTGKTEIVNNYLEGLKDGPSVAYFPSGKKQNEGNYIAGEEEGKWNFYNPDGTLYKTGFYKNGNADSIWTNYHYNHKIKSVTHYKADQPIDTARYFNPAGEFMFALIFSNNGLRAYQYESATGLVTKYINIKDAGSFKTYFKTGQISSEQNYNGGILVGKRIFYYASGNKYLEFNVNNEDYEGEFAEYYPTGKPKELNLFK
ncbi:MAG: hypothetical protein HC905_19940 [Bacteroidales bacterium]|nr:hypothetical protein [Bacteroidales bacterium]